MGRTKDFSKQIKLNCLLWSDRHCCICGEECRLDIQIAHINENGKKDQDNAIPVCYKCHADMGRYNDKHPLGNKYRFEELKKRREQIYERSTSNLVPSILAFFRPVSSETGIELPLVGFSIIPVGRFIPVQARISVRVFLGGRDLGEIESTKPYYNNKIVWNLNPGLRFNGNFSLPIACAEEKEKTLQLELRVTVIDPYEREHEQLPVCFTYDRKGKYWFLEPTSFNELKTKSEN